MACWDVYAWVWPGYTKINEGTAVVDGGAIKINAPNAGDGVSFDFPVTPNIAQQLSIDIDHISLNRNASVQIMEQQGGEWVQIAVTPVNVESGGLVIPFTPRGNSIRVVWHGQILVWVRHDCISKLEWVEEDQLVTICNGDKDRYIFGYNGQEKVNEWSGIGNHNTAKFWEYDTRTGRRLNLDPVIHYSLSPYAAFSLSPIWKVDPNGDDDYYNRKAKYLGTDGNGHRLRVVDNKDLQTASAFNNFMKLKMQKSKSLLNPPPLLLSNFRVLYSRPISFKNEGATFKQMLQRSNKDNRERGAYLIFDANKAQVRLSNVEVGERRANELDMYFQAGSNVFSKKGNEVTILGSIHTHQQEGKYKKMGYTDYQLFKSQYQGNGDGQRAKNSKDNIYSIGSDNVNYYSPEGEKNSSNNSGSKQDLESGKYNIGKETLEKYGKQPVKNGLGWFVFLGLFLGFFSSCNQKNKNEIMEQKGTIDKGTFSEKHIIYTLEPSLTKFVEDSVFISKENKVVYCVFESNSNYDNNRITFYYKIDGRDSLIMYSTNRYFKIGERLIPVGVSEDYQFGHPQVKGRSHSHNLCFAIVEFNNFQKVTYFTNYLKLCN